jgi:hypothetical protein
MVQETTGAARVDGARTAVAVAMAMAMAIQTALALTWVGIGYGHLHVRAYGACCGAGDTFLEAGSHLTAYAIFVIATGSVVAAWATLNRRTKGLAASVVLLALGMLWSAGHVGRQWPKPGDRWAAAHVPRWYALLESGYPALVGGAVALALLAPAIAVTWAARPRKAGHRLI